MAITKQVVRSPSGGISVQYLDDKSGERVLGYRPEAYAGNNYGDGEYANEKYFGENQEAENPEILEEEIIPELAERTNTGSYNNESFGKPTDRSVANNYGFQENSLAGRIMGLMPGVTGLPGKALAVAENINNNVAVDKAKETLGNPEEFSPQSARQNIAGALGKNKTGQVANVSVGGKTYSVGLTAQDPRGITNMTPEEARTRGLLSKTGLKKATEEEVTAQTKDAKKAGIKKETSLPGIAGVATDAFGAVKDAVTGKTKEAKAVTKDVRAEEDEAPATTAAPVGQVSRAALGTTAPTNESISRNPFDKQTEARAITPGLGLANLTSNQDRLGLPGMTDETAVKDVAFDKAFAAPTDVTPVGKDRYAPAAKNVMDTISNVVGTTLGPGFGITTVSGTYTPEHAARVEAARQKATEEGKAKGLKGKALADSVKSAVSAEKGIGEHANSKGVGSNRHSTTLAADFGITNTETGQVASPEQRDAVVSALGAAGLSVGYGPGYMGSNIHADDTRPSNPNSWASGIPAGMKESQMEAAHQRTTLGTYGAIATPATNPGINAPYAAEDTPTAAPTASYNPMDAIDAMTAAAEQAPGLAGYSNKGIAPGAVSAAGFTNMGLGAQYSEDEKSAMAATLAGELGPNTLAGLAKADPAAQKEASAVLGTLDNRTQAPSSQSKANPMGAALTGYDAFDKNNLSRTLANLEATAPAVTSAVEGYLSGKAPTSKPEATHYANYDVAGIDTSWAGAPNSQQIGQHTFSTPDKSFGSIANYGIGVGPVSGVSIAGPTGVAASPASTYGSQNNPTGIGSVTGMNPSAAPGLGSALGGTSLGGWGPSASSVGVSGVSQDTTDSSAAAAGAAASSAEGAQGVGADSDSDSDGGSKGGGDSAGGAASGLGGTKGNSPGGQTGFGGMGGTGSTGSTGSANSGQNR